MPLSNVIRVFNEQQHISRMLYSLTQHTYLNPEIILVVSGSTASTLSLAACGIKYPLFCRF